ncbi:MAG: FAD:protein FMN transferase [Phycisphaerales bacterium JB040]
MRRDEGTAPGIARDACEAMGCRFEFVITDPGRADASGVVSLRALLEECRAVVLDWHDRLSLFSAGSVTSLLNREAAHRPVRVSDDVMELLLLCARVHRESSGAFDPTVGPLMRSLGFRGEPGPGAEPVWGMRHVELDTSERLVRFARAGIELDFGGVAKGWALDECAALLREAGVAGAVLHGGTSTAVAIGPARGTRACTIALAGGDGPVVELRDAALSVSAPHGRVVERAGRRMGHVLDPRTGEAVESGPVAAVLGDSAGACDAWSTGLLVAGTVSGSHGSGFTRILCDASGAWSVRGPHESCVRLRGSSESSTEGTGSDA